MLITLKIISYSKRSPIILKSALLDRIEFWGIPDHVQIDADYELPNEEENERHDIQIEEIGCIYASFNFKNLVLITTFTFEKLGENYMMLK